MSTIGEVQAAIAACDTGGVKLHDAAKHLDTMVVELKAADAELKKIDLKSGVGKKLATLVTEARGELKAAQDKIVGEFMVSYSTTHGQVTDKFKSAYKGKLSKMQDDAKKKDSEEVESETEEDVKK